MTQNLHLLQPPLVRGPAPNVAAAVTILIHGRSQSSADMFVIADRLALPDMTYVAINAEGNSWYPGRFMEPLERNQPRLDHALERIDVLIESLLNEGVERSRIIFVGFSQGACLACEYLYRNAERWGGLVAYTGGLIGPESIDFPVQGNFAGTPIFLGNSDIDEWVPVERTEQTRSAFKLMGAAVKLHVYPGMAHLVNDREIAYGQALLKQVLSNSSTKSVRAQLQAYS
ncbi:alpha/beta hydrolase [Pseudomonas sp. CFBP 13602]|uniref:alpha/beta hydrolase n=1 Tax=Pseudomonas sp. CFBP 13602 TaxID=2774039 RepID=UPI001786C9CB|nr:dienelactone hydrolase family protein [Pseudomonas sp. CFBP 13602]MBD8828576.1 dienelactone hydrolase family protein [Pseudomonas sp. CFBP 13602]